ncbi:MAG: rod shape-determining protein [Chloroflexi bacterium HGW-Chloroflexi-9]|nr:rod shape-determining protein [Dehalococcoidia bacterium]MDP2328563.1 rod shape-determining protein [Dehalococcoidia bacterium]PKN81985.1 MAG: rod shape-determining protein [Chloroflexi bacterium HGW-Chloroflexi-9]
MFSKRIGIDLGTANVLVYEQGRGVVLDEPAVVAIAERDNTVVAVGIEARAMIGRHPGSIQVIRPMRDGVIADYLITEAMLRYFIARVVGRFNIVRPEVMICVPVGVTGVEQRAVRDAAEAAGARRPAHLIPEPLAAAIGAEIPVGSPRGHMVIDIGGGRTEAAVISLFGIVASESVRIAGDRLDDAIAQYIKRRHNLVIGERTAEEVKIAIGSAVPLDEELTTGVRGRDQITGLPRTITLRSSEVTQAIQEHLATIVQTSRRVLERTPPELASDVIDRGIVLTGGGALLRGLDQLILQETGVPVHVADDPLRCVAKGAGMALDYIDVIARSLPTEEESLIGEMSR